MANLFRIRNKVAAMFYAIHDSDRILAEAERKKELKTPIDHGPINSMTLTIPRVEFIAAGFAVCEMLHLAALADDKVFLAVGPNDVLKVLATHWDNMVASGTVNAAEAITDEAYDCLTLPTDTLNRRVGEIRAMRESTNRIRHHVVQLFPEMRIWPKDIDYDPESLEEVQLRRAGLRLGGLLCQVKAQ